MVVYWRFPGELLIRGVDQSCLDKWSTTVSETKTKFCLSRADAGEFVPMTGLRDGNCEPSSSVAQPGGTTTTTI